MENKNVVLLRHHPRDLKFTNKFYTNQVEDDLSNYVIIDVTSRCDKNKEFMNEHPNFVKEISPFYIGPVVSSDGVQANIFEIYWQCGKVYPCHDDNGKPNKDYFDWRNSFYSKEVCSKDLMRHACKDLGYDHGDTRYFAYYDKDKKEYIPLNYVQSRKKVYMPEYAKLVYNTESFKWIKSLVDSGKKVAIVDFDAYNYNYENALIGKYKEYVNRCKKYKYPITLKVEEFTSVNTIKKALNCTFMKAGHGFAIKLLLDGSISVNEDGTINDPEGLLEI